MAYRIKNKFPIDLEKRKAVGFSFPFSGDGVFTPTYTTKDQLKSNLINFFLTNRGERYMNPSFGANLRSFVFENIADGNLQVLKNQIQDDISKYFPNVQIYGLNITKNEA